MTPSPDLLVVGSGFGGSVVALRAAEAGLRVVVLERGRDYPPGTFPRAPRQADEVLWRAAGTSHGLYDLRFLSGLGVVAAAGVGGGSLVFAGVLIQPDDDVFDGWPDAVREGLAAGFDRARAVLQPTPLPASLDVPKRDAFLAAARALGRTAFDPPLAIGWDAATAPGGVPCRLDAQCELGCTAGAKRSLDATYLAAARRAGATVQPGTLVSHVSPDPLGGYAVHCRSLDGAAQTLRAPRVVLGAGTLGTNEILLRSRDTLTRLSPRLGQGISANGDFIGMLRASHRPLQPSRGPDVTSVLRSLPGEPPFTMVAPTTGRAALKVVASWGQPPLGWLRPLAPVLWPRLPGLLRAALRSGLLSRPLPLRLPGAGDPEAMSFLFAMGRDDAGGRAVLRGGRLDVRWRYARANAGLVDTQRRAMADLAAAYGGTSAPLLTWGAFGRPVSFHPLGGCWLSDTPGDGVVSPDGEVHGHPGLFVADGSAVRGALGFHPALTIAALAEHVAERGVLA